MKIEGAKLWLTKKVLRKNELLQDLDDERLETLIKHAQARLLATGDYLYTRGEPSNDTFCAIVFGSLKVVIETGRVVKVTKSGELMGEMGITSIQRKRTADVIATEPTSILEWTFSDIRDKAPYLKRKLEKLASERRS